MPTAERRTVSTAEERHHEGPDGYCICPRCETRLAHRQGVRCRDERCPRCGAKMLREGSEHHELWLRRHQERAGG